MARASTDLMHACKLSMEKMIGDAARVIVIRVACLRRNFNVLIICGLHNKVFAERLVLESYSVGAYPYLWVFDERLLLKYSKFSENAVATLPKHVRCLLENSDVIMWLSQYDDLEKFPENVRKAIVSFWDAVYEAIKAKPRL